MDPTGVRMASFEGEGSGLGELNEIPHSKFCYFETGRLVVAHMSWKEARAASHPIEYIFRQVSSEWGHWKRNGGPNPNP